MDAADTDVEVVVEKTSTGGADVPKTAELEPDKQALSEKIDDWLGVALITVGWGATLTTFTTCIATICVAAEPFSPATGLNTFPLACVFFSISVGQVILPCKLKR